MVNLVKLLHFEDNYTIPLKDVEINENSTFLFYNIDKNNRGIIGDDNGNIVCRFHLSGLKLNIIDDIINRSKKTIYTYKIKLEKNHYYSSTFRYHSNIDIYLDLDKLKKKLINKKIYSNNTFDSLIVNKINNLKRFDADFWKERNSIRTQLNLSQPDLLQVKLFEYQLKTLFWMVDLEKRIFNKNNLLVRTTFPINSIIGFDENINLYYDIIDNKIVSSERDKEINLKGGILADEMGLGKTITSVALILANQLNISLPIIDSKNKNYNTKATLIICPSHLTKQWAKELQKGAPILKRISILTKVNHQKISYQDILDSDVVIISIQFLINFNYYVEHNYEHTTPSQIMYNFKDRVNKLNTFKENLQLESLETQLATKSPNFEFINWYRIIIDEGHEIFGDENGNASSCIYLKKWLKTINSQFNWYVSGTPFINNNGFNAALDFINFSVKRKINLKYLDLKKNKYIPIKKEYNIKFDELIEQRCDILPFNKNILKCVYYRNTKESVKDELNIPSILTEKILIELSEIERNLYDTKLEYGCSRLALRQLCCHPLISDKERNILGNSELSLSEVRDGLLNYHKENIKKYEKKLKSLDTNNQSFHMLSKTYKDKINESTYLINIFDNILNTEKKIELKEDMCCICMDVISQIVVTDCGHFYCKECIHNSLKFKKECPTCRKSLTSDKIYHVNKKNEEPKKESKNALVELYGSKMGKLIALCKKITSNKKNRIIIFSQWDRMLHLIGNTLKENLIENTFVKGNVYQRNNAISSFKEGKNKSKKDIQVIMLSLENAASGTNLTEATHVIFTDPIDGEKEEILAIENQAIGRACRIGQKNQVKVLKLITKDTIEEEISLI